MPPMTDRKAFVSVADLRELRVGDTVRGRLSGAPYVVTGNYGDHVTAVRTVDITQPNEWEVARDA